MDLPNKLPAELIAALRSPKTQILIARYSRMVDLSKNNGGKPIDYADHPLVRGIKLGTSSSNSAGASHPMGD